MGAGGRLRTRALDPNRGGEQLRDRERLSAKLFSTNAQEEQSGRDALDEAPLPNGLGVHAGQLAQLRAPLSSKAHRVASEQLPTPSAHRHREVAGPFGEQPVGIHELETRTHRSSRARSYKRVRSMSVAVNQHAIPGSKAASRDFAKDSARSMTRSEQAWSHSDHAAAMNSAKTSEPSLTQRETADQARTFHAAPQRARR